MVTSRENAESINIYSYNELAWKNFSNMESKLSAIVWSQLYFENRSVNKFRKHTTNTSEVLRVYSIIFSKYSISLEWTFYTMVLPLQ